MTDPDPTEVLNGAQQARLIALDRAAALLRSQSGLASKYPGLPADMMVLAHYVVTGEILEGSDSDEDDPDANTEVPDDPQDLFR